MYFYTSVYFKTSETKTTIYPDKISDHTFPNLYRQADHEFSLDFYLNTHRELSQLAFEQLV